MRIVAISDLHGKLDFNVPEADLLLIAGDLCPAYHDASMSMKIQADWLDSHFRYWLLEQPITECVACAGNHDWIWEKYPDKVPQLNTNFHYLEDREIEILGLKIYGTPVQPPFCHWAFNKSKEDIQKYWDNIPEELDILLLHSPPYGIMDKVCHSYSKSKNIGSKSLKERIDKVKPKIVVFGHNHNEYGKIEQDGVIYVNASLLDERYNMSKEPIILEI